MKMNGLPVSRIETENIDWVMPHKKIFIDNNTHWCSVAWRSVTRKSFLIYTINHTVVISASVAFSRGICSSDPVEHFLRITQIRISFSVCVSNRHHMPLYHDRNYVPMKWNVRVK